MVFFLKYLSGGNDIERPELACEAAAQDDQAGRYPERKKKAIKAHMVSILGGAKKKACAQLRGDECAGGFEDPQISSSEKIVGLGFYSLLGQ